MIPFAFAVLITITLFAFFVFAVVSKMRLLISVSALSAFVVFATWSYCANYQPWQMTENKCYEIKELNWNNGEISQVIMVDGELLNVNEFFQSAVDCKKYNVKKITWQTCYYGLDFFIESRKRIPNEKTSGQEFVLERKIEALN